MAGNDGAVAVDERSSMARGGRVSWHGEGWWSAREGVVGWHPSWLFFFPPIRTRMSRTYDRRGPRKAPAGATHTCRGRGVRAREGGAFARSFQRIRRRDADALPRLRHLSRHATAGIFPLSRVINERRLGQRRPTDRQPVHDDACRTPVAC